MTEQNHQHVSFLHSVTEALCCGLNAPPLHSAPPTHSNRVQTTQHDRCFTWKASFSGSPDVHPSLYPSPLLPRYELRMRYFPKGYLSHFSEDRPSLNYLYHQVTAQTRLCSDTDQYAQRRLLPKCKSVACLFIGASRSKATTCIT